MQGKQLAPLALACLLTTTRVIVNGCVFVSVSSLPERKLELNWNCAEDEIDTVTLYSKDPVKVPDKEPLAEILVSNATENYFKTDVDFNPEPFPGGWSVGGQKQLKDICLYWAVGSLEGKPIHSHCLGIHPAWMWQNREDLKNLSLPKMFLPGTHNSGSDRIKMVSKRSVGGKLENFVLTQDQPIWNQLVFGIRYLDLRIGYYSSDEESRYRFWINHDLLRVQPLVPVLRDVAKFSKASPGEIIVIDFHRFPVGFKPRSAFAIHEQLIEVIEHELGNLAIPRPFDQTELTLEQIWSSDKRIVISYSEENVVKATPWLWDSIPQKWGNKQRTEDLEQFLETSFEESSNIRKIWAAMAELTPTPFDFLSNGSLRGMADNINRLLNKWFVEKNNWARRANVVATDFFLGNNIVDIAIRTNLEKSQNSTTV